MQRAHRALPPKCAVFILLIYSVNQTYPTPGTFFFFLSLSLSLSVSRPLPLPLCLPRPLQLSVLCSRRPARTQYTCG